MKDAELLRLRAVKDEMLALGRVQRSQRHPLWVVGVLTSLYQHTASGVDREALAYAVALLFELYSSSGSDF